MLNMQVEGWSNAQMLYEKCFFFLVIVEEDSRAGLLVVVGLQETFISTDGSGGKSLYLDNS